MRTSIALSILILAIAAAIGMRFDQRLAEARTLSGKLATEAARSGISTDSSNPARPPRSTKRLREAGENPVRLAADFIAVSWDLKMLRDTGADVDSELMRRASDLRTRIGLLNFSQAKVFIAELKSNGDLAEDNYQDIIYSLLNDLALEQPQAVLAFLTESPDILRNDDRYKFRLINNAIFGWAKEDPLGALDWIHKDSVVFSTGPDWVVGQAEKQVMYGAVGTNPKLAFEIFGRSAIDDKSGTLHTMLKYPRTTETRTATLAAYREYVATFEVVKKGRIPGRSGIESLSKGVIEEGFVAGSEWLAGAELSPDELEIVTDNIVPRNINEGERAQWIDWIGTNLPPANAHRSITKHVEDWAMEDSQAAAEWLAAETNDLIRSSAIEGYAFVVTRGDPEFVNEWVMTLPPGKDRDQGIRDVARFWKTYDQEGKAAKAAFERAHGIE